MGVKQRLRHLRIGVEDRSIWHRFRRNVSITLLGSGVSLAIKLAQTALLTRLLKIDDYGRVLIVLNLFVFLDSFFGLSVSDVMFRFFQQLKEQEDARSLKGLLILCLAISLVSGLLICSGVLVLSPWLADRIYPGLGLSPLLNIYGCTVLVSSFQRSLRANSANLRSLHCHRCATSDGKSRHPHIARRVFRDELHDRR